LLLLLYSLHKPRLVNTKGPQSLKTSAFQQNRALDGHGLKWLELKAAMKLLLRSKPWS